MTVLFDVVFQNFAYFSSESAFLFTKLFFVLSFLCGGRKYRFGVVGWDITRNHRSLYALLHNVMRTIQVMLSSSDADDSTFKLFGKFEVGYVQHQIRKQLMEQQQQLHQDHSDNRNSSNNTASITGDDGKSIDECESGCRQRNGNTNTSSSNHSRNNYAIFCCLLCSLLSGLLGGLFLVEQLVNLLSIGTLLMLYALTIDIIILR